MARQIPPGFADVRIVLQATGDPEPWNVTFGISLSEVGGDLDAAATNVFAAYDAAFSPNSSNIVTITRVDLIVGQDGPDNLIFSKGFNGGGAGSGGYLPQNCALLVQKRSALGGRRNRGRFYVPLVLPEGQVDNVGVIDGATVSAFQTTVDDMFDQLANGFVPGEDATPMVILHEDEGPATPDPTFVTSLSVSNVIATQRRRLR